MAFLIKTGQIITGSLASPYHDRGVGLRSVRQRPLIMTGVWADVSQRNVPTLEFELHTRTIAV